MRKRIAGKQDAQQGNTGKGWLDLDQIATVEVSSEDPSFPVESVFDSKDGAGWRASQPGEQRIRIIFDQPVALRRIQLRFHESECERTQEFSLRWCSASAEPWNEIVRQQWNFSLAGSTRELEDYSVDLETVSVLELVINPDVSRRGAIATLASWRLG